MNIDIKQINGATWVLEGDTWYCQHDAEVVMEEVEESYYGNGEIVSDTSTVPVCSDCDEQLEQDYDVYDNGDADYDMLKDRELN